MKLTGLTTEKKENIFVLSIALTTIAIRIAAIFILANLNDPELWEFGMIARNMLNGEGFTFLALTQNVPSAFMPPGLPILYYSIFELFGENYTGYLTILLLNAILGGITVILSYKLAREMFSQITAVITSVYICFSPILIYSSVTFNSIIIYQLLLLMFFFLLRKITIAEAGKHIKDPAFLKTVVYLSIVLGIFLYFRAEALFFVLAIFLFSLVKKHLQHALIILFVSIAVISPWTIRNYVTFDEFIPVTTSFGYNFYIGHGDDASTLVYKNKIQKIKEDRFFEINQSEMAYELAINYIKLHPSAEIRESFNKIYSLWVFDTYRDSAKEPIYLIIWVPTLVLFFFGTFSVFTDKSKCKPITPVYVYLLFSTILTVLFFNIPRYQIQMSIVIIPVAMYGLTILYNNFKTKITK